ncbi:MAG: hypothetical protein M3Y59_02495 [Myxococcota bacterium]|nr:hypothetical protein [Myxococcota bacterium]
MSCSDPRFASALEELQAGGLTVERWDALREHVTGCDACRLDYERISQVESRLERRLLPAARQELMEASLFSRLGIARPEDRKVLRPARWSVGRAMAVVVPLAACLVLAVLLAPRLLSSSGEFQPRGGGSENPYGIRAFCVDAQAQVVSEARTGQTLHCAPGQSVQFSHTSPQPVSLHIVGEGRERLTFFPAEGGSAQIPSGVDVPLPFSTPVRKEWLDRPLPVTAIFQDPQGKVLGENQIVITPAAGRSPADGAP